MPYKLVIYPKKPKKRAGKYCAINLRTGKRICFKTKQKRKKGLRIREAFAHGWKMPMKTNKNREYKGLFQNLVKNRK